MKLRHTTARLAVAGSAVALMAGGLVATTGVAANADTGSASYNCTNGFTPDILPLEVSVGADLSALPPLPTGFAAPAGALPITVDFTLSPEVVNGLIANGITSAGAASEDMKLPFGNTQVPLAGVSVAPVSLTADTETVLTAEAANGAFKLPSPGTDIPVKMPASFSATSILPIPIDCTLVGESPTISQLTVIKQTPTLVAKAPKSIKKGATLKVTATLTANVPPTGKVVAKEGSKTLGNATLKGGKATISIKGLKPGTHSIMVSYAGDKNSNASNVYGVTVTVKK